MFYSLGWLNRLTKGDCSKERRQTSHWHTGSLDGTATLLVRRHDQWSWAVLFNARMSPTAKHLARVVDPRMHQALAEREGGP